MKLFKMREERYEEYPQIVYENRKIKKDVLAYLKYVGCSSFRIILKDLGFTKDDIIYLYAGSKDMEFLYSVNEKQINSDNKMIFNCGFLFESPPYIILKNSCEKIKYQCVRSEPEKDLIWFDKSYYVRNYPGNREYSRRYSIYGYYSWVSKDDYKLNVSLYDAIGIEEYSDVHKISNEKELEEYLISLNFPIKLDEVYKRVIEIIGEDISKYIKFKLEVNKYNENKLNRCDTTDIIELENGELVKYGMTIDNKTIFIDKDDNWSYRITKDDGKTLCYSLVSSNGNLDYKINENDNRDFQMVFSDNLEEAKSEVENVKTRVRNILRK